MKDIKVDSNKVTQNDFPELEGKVIQYTVCSPLDGTEGRTISGVVIGCNRQVGVTIVNANNKDYFLVCAAGPILPDHQNYDPDTIENYDAWFNAVVDGVQKGSIKSFDLLKARKGVGNGGNADGGSCAYSR